MRWLLWRCGSTFGRHGSLGCFRIRHDTCRIAIEVNPLGTRYQATPIYASATVGFQASIGLAFRQPSAYQVISNTHLQRFGSALQKGQRIALQQEQYLSLEVGAHGRCSIARGACAYQDGQRECVHRHVSQEYSSLDATFFPSTRGGEGLSASASAQDDGIGCRSRGGDTFCGARYSFLANTDAILGS
jgi:hypothetical protein